MAGKYEELSQAELESDEAKRERQNVHPWDKMGINEDRAVHKWCSRSDLRRFQPEYVMWSSALPLLKISAKRAGSTGSTVDGAPSQ